MELATLILRLLGCGVLIIAGIGKLVDRDGGARALKNFGIPDRLVGAVVVVLPLAEIAVALALLPATTAAAAAAAAAGLFGAFTFGIARALRRGETPDCHCFGAVHSSPVTRLTLTRTGGLAIAAIFVAAAEWRGSPLSAVAWVGDLSPLGALALAEGIALLGVLAGAAWLALHLLRQNGRVLLRLDAVERAAGLVPGAVAHERPPGLEVGSPAPPFRLRSAAGGEVKLPDLGSRALLVFADSGCAPCRGLFSELGDWASAPEDLQVAVVLSGDPEVASAVPRQIPVLFDSERKTQADYAIVGTPTAVLVVDERIAADPAPGSPAIQRLLEEISGPPLEVVRAG